MLCRAAFFASLIVLAGCGGSDGELTKPEANDVGAKAVADVDAAKAETLRAETQTAPAAPTN